MNDKDLIELIRLHADGLSSKDDHLRLQQRLASDPAARRLLRRYSGLDAAIPTVLSGHAQQDASAIGRRIKAAAALSMVAAAGLILALTGQFADGGSPAATIVRSQGARWTDCGLPTEPGMPLGPGRLRLLEGVSELRFSDGTTVTIEGPADLEISGSGACFLHYGTLTGRTEKSGGRLNVGTTHALIEAGGSAFSLHADIEGNVRVHVMEGEASLRRRGSTDIVRLGAGQMSRASGQGLFAAALVHEPDMTPWTQRDESYTSTVSTREGRGAATHVAQDKVNAVRDGRLLLLKSCDEDGYGRRILLRFDLGTAPLNVNMARLQLHLSPTGLGHPSLSGDAHVGVYLVDDEGDGWHPDQIDWAGQPATHPDASKVDVTKARRIGEIVIPGGVSTGSVSVEGPGLADAVRKDANRIMTLLLVRENPIRTKWGHVLGFAGNAHPSLPPPTLSLR